MGIQIEQLGQHLRSADTISTDDLSAAIMGYREQYFPEPNSAPRPKIEANSKPRILLDPVLALSIFDKAKITSPKFLEDMSLEFNAIGEAAKRSGEMRELYESGFVAQSLASMAQVSTLEHNSSDCDCLTSALFTACRPRLERDLTRVEQYLDTPKDTRGQSPNSNWTLLRFFLITQSHKPELFELVKKAFEIFDPTRSDGSWAMGTHTELLVDTILAIAERTPVQLSPNPATRLGKENVEELIMLAWSWLEAWRDTDVSKSRGPDPRWTKILTKLSGAVEQLKQTFEISEQLQALIETPLIKEDVRVTV